MPLHDWTRVPSGLFHHFHQDWSIEITRALNRERLPTAPVDNQTLRTWFPWRLDRQYLRPVNYGENMDFSGGDFVDHAVLPFDDFADVGILVLSDHLSGPGESSEVPGT